MRVFLDTNVLVAAFTTRGLCADVLRAVLAEHTLVTGEAVLKELRRVLRTRMRVPTTTLDDIESFLREHEVVPRPPAPATLPVRDPDDRWILASAIDGAADVLVTGDRDLLDIASESSMEIVTPRGFWERMR